MRIQAALNEQSRNADQAFRADEAAKDRSARAAENEADRALRTQETQADREFRSSEATKDRQLRASEGAADRSLMQQRLSREESNAEETNYLRQLNAIDTRIAKLTDMKTKAGLDSGGMPLDPTMTAGIDNEIASLQEQKTALNQIQNVARARRGDKRFTPISPEEADRLLADSRTQRGAAQDGAPRAAQAPEGGTSIKTPPQRPAIQVPQAPPMNADMASRMNRNAVSDVDTSAQQAVAPTAANLSNAQIAGAGTGGQGARDLFGAVSGALDSLKGRREEGPQIAQIKQALEAGEQVSPAQLNVLQNVGRARLRGLYGFDEAALQQLGL